jgi:N-carbamoylputrescine amidase
MNRSITLALIQMTCSTDVKTNFDKTVDRIRNAAQQGAQIVCTQELFKSTYFPQTEDWRAYELAEEVHESSPTVIRLRQLASELEIVLVAGLFEKRALGIYHNCAVVIDADGSYLGKYRKMHIPDDPHYYEKFFFTPGDLGYKTFNTRYAHIGVLICWDQWFSEAARLLGLQGVEIIFIPTAIGFSAPEDDRSYRESWQIVQQGHAVANACYLAAVNRVGFEADPSNNPAPSQGKSAGVGPNGENGIDFWGCSFISNPEGQIIKQASQKQEEVLLETIDLSFIEKTKQRFSFPYRDRRIDSYQDLLKLYSCE